MVILPLLYLFWWKKKWRLIIGISIIAIVAIGFFTPGEIIYSILTREIEKEEKTTQKIRWILKKVSEQKIDSENLKKKLIKPKK